MPLMSADANLLTDSSVSANAVAVHPAQGDLSGTSILSGDAFVFVSLSGQATGVATVSNSTITLYEFMSGHDGGYATTSTDLFQYLPLLSGRTVGFATVIQSFVPLPIVQLLSGKGGGIATTRFLPFEVTLSGKDGGHATLTDYGPLPIYGLSGASAFLLLTQIPLPVNCTPRPISSGSVSWCKHSFNLFKYPPFPKPGEPRWADRNPYDITDPRNFQSFHHHRDSCGCDRWDCNPCVPKKFRWGYMFTYGDLMLYVKDLSGNPLSPYEVTYTMYQVAPTGAVMQAGPSGKSGVMQHVGVYYAVGTAGENGQPGNWLVRWEYRRSFSGVSTMADCQFTVVDSVSKPIPGDPTCRQQKYGWD